MARGPDAGEEYVVRGVRTLTLCLTPPLVARTHTCFQSPLRSAILNYCFAALMTGLDARNVAFTVWHGNSP